MLRPDGEGGEGGRLDHPALGAFDRQAAEQDMAHQLAALADRDQRDEAVAVGPQLVDQVGLRALSEGVREDVADVGNVARLLDADDDRLAHAAAAARI